MSASGLPPGLLDQLRPTVTDGAQHAFSVEPGPAQIAGPYVASSESSGSQQAKCTEQPVIGNSEESNYKQP
jgi:hypothetical protein